MPAPRTTLLGRVVGPPEVKQTSTGGAMVQFRVAVNDFRSGKEAAAFFPVYWFVKPECKLIPWVQKGTEVYIDGSLWTEEYTDQGGQKKYYTSISAYGAKSIQFPGAKQQQQQQQAAPPYQGGQQPYAPPAQQPAYAPPAAPPAYQPPAGPPATQPPMAQPPPPPQTTYPPQPAPPPRSETTSPQGAQGQPGQGPAVPPGGYEPPPPPPGSVNQ